ncbi:hypothetical protein BMBphi_gp073 [Bacillus phage vB_BthS_BMBphi]|nr:hypothetical protein BMBphi_gp073 [Bacillus phage vB_BthS_BMBphi]
MVKPKLRKGINYDCQRGLYRVYRNGNTRWFEKEIDAKGYYYTGIVLNEYTKK